MTSIEIPMPTKQIGDRTFTAIGFYKGIPVWPVEEYLARRGVEFTKLEQRKMKRLNPEGVIEGNDPRMD